MTTATRAEVLALASDIKRHDGATLAFATALFAEYGASGIVGRQLDRYATLNSHMLYALENQPAVRELSLRQIHDPTPDAPPSTVAATMLANPHCAPGRRLKPMPRATREAARAYASERVELLERTLAMVRRNTTLRQELRTWRRLRDILGRGRRSTVCEPFHRDVVGFGATRSLRARTRSARRP
jgi:hypothetical protein